MSNNFKNWVFSDIQKFLKKNNFLLLRRKGSHFHFYKKENSKTFLVTIPFHGKKSIKIRTMKNIVKNSGIEKEEWFSFKNKKNIKN